MSLRKTVVVADVYPETLNSAITEFRKNNQYEPYLIMNMITASMINHFFDSKTDDYKETNGSIYGIYLGCRVYIDEDIKNGVVKLV